MPKNILVPIDISQEATIAGLLEATKTLLVDPNDRVFLLNVIEELPPYVDIQLPAGIHERAESDAVAALEGIKSDGGLPESTAILVRTGHASRTILEEAEKIGSDVIVLASHDPGLADYLLGSVAARVVRHAHCSVHVVRQSDTVARP